RLFGRKPNNPGYDKNKCKALANKIAQRIDDLEQQLHHADGAEIEWKDTVTQKTETESEDEDSLEIKASPISLSGGMKDKEKDSFSAESQVQEKFKRAKVDYLRRHVMNYQAVFDEMAEISGGDSFLFLDDLYHIRKEEQARVVDYVHSIAKGHK